MLERTHLETITRPKYTHDVKRNGHSRLEHRKLYCRHFHFMPVSFAPQGTRLLMKQARGKKSRFVGTG